MAANDEKCRFRGIYRLSSHHIADLANTANNNQFLFGNQTEKSAKIHRCEKIDKIPWDRKSTT